MLFTTVVSLLALAASGLTAPTLGPQELIVVSPNITSPQAGDFWLAGSTQVVRWNTANIPPAAAKNTGLLLIGHITIMRDQDGKEYPSENLDINHPLASGFRLTDGNVTVVVPHIIPRDDYMLVLFGDSGNTSPTFTIL
ncbi:hypothetical protein C8F01DRAFT_1048453 [Mycena amicta]|nr:hypothetical protein C8F01DRAFT_1048453 [Mycena amicta]